MDDLIYLDYNATTPIDKDVVEAMLPYLQTHFGNPSSTYAIGHQTKEAVHTAREKVAELINASPEEIIFTSGGTESNNMAIRGIALANKEKGKHIITSEVEHPAVIEVCKHLYSKGWAISYLPVDRNGAVSSKDVQNAIRKDTTLITIMHANNEVGTIQPIEEIGLIAKKHQIIFHTDAAQSLGKIKTDVDSLGIDLLTIAGHKLYAPKGIGALFIKKGTKLNNILFGAGQEFDFRPGTENVPYIVALGKACEIAMKDFDRNTGNMKLTRDNLLKGLKAKLPNQVYENVDLKNCLPNTLSVSFKGLEAHTLTSILSNSIAISTGSACHADSVEISPILKAINLEVEKATGTVRISTGKDTSKQDIDKAIEIISDTVNKLNQ